jgi:hypothetical protein
MAIAQDAVWEEMAFFVILFQIFRFAYPME